MRTPSYLAGFAISICTCLVGTAPAWAQSASTAATSPYSPVNVTLVLGGGGAKGFAHLAILRRLERDNVKISKIIGTSVGAVIGGLYASGMSTDDIEKFVKSMDDPFKVALDQVDRTDLPHRSRAYQQQYPVDIEVGVKNGQFSFARGVSDGQRFLTVLQELTANVPPNTSFDNLKVPFRAVATRYFDGELTAFNHGNLALAIRASMAAPAVFAPVEIDGQTYVDGGLVANLPVEVALREGADVIIASYLGDNTDEQAAKDSGNALTVANQMLTILMRQNEKRNLAMLRPQDILVRPQLKDLGSGDFDKASQITLVGQQAVASQDARFQALAQVAAHPDSVWTINPPSFSEREITIARISVTGNEVIPADYVKRGLVQLIGKEYKPTEVGTALNDLYTTGNFERLNYELVQIDGGIYELAVDVNEKTYGPNYFRTSLGFLSEIGGINMFAMGLGYRRPWLSPTGLELNVDVGVGAQSTLGASLYQPFGNGWGLNTYADYRSQELPLYRPDVSNAERIALSTIRRQEMGVDLSYDFSKKFTAKVGLSTNQTSVTIDTARQVSYLADDGQTISYKLQDVSEQFSSVNLEFTADQLDSASFPTTGYYADLESSRTVNRVSQTDSYRLRSLWAQSFGPHVINLGLNLGSDHVFECDNCFNNSPVAPLFLGGFQAMGAYQYGQLNGDRLVHAQSTYMYRLSEGGIFRQRTYVGFVAEVGDAWLHTQAMSLKYSGTAFIAVDSKIGDIYFGLASGSGNNKNAFVQLGRRFTVW
jgi:NTE family protein